MKAEPVLMYKEAQPFVAIRSKVAMADINEKLPPHIQEISEWLASRNITPKSPVFFRYLEMFPDNTLTVEVGFTTAIPVAGTDRMLMGTLPAGTYTVYTHFGHYNTLFGAWSFLDKWAEQKGIKLYGVYTNNNSMHWPSRSEFYLTDPTTETDPNKWQTDLVCLVMPS